MMESVKDFVLDTQKQCFFCLTQILNLSLPSGVSEQETSDHSFTSIHCFSRYLGFDMRKVFSENEKIASALLSQVDRSRLKVELCEDCTATNGKLSTLYEQLEKIELEMYFHLKRIQEKMVSVEDGRMSKLNSNKGSKRKHKIVELLRIEALQKCSRKLSMPSPRVKVQNISVAQLDVMKRKKREQRIVDVAKEAFDSARGRQSDIKFERDNLFQTANEEECHTNYSDFDNNDNIDNDEQFQKDSDDELDISFKKRKKSRKHFKVRRSSVGTTTKSETGNSNAPPENIKFDHKTGKHKCGICSKKFCTKQVAQIHHKNIHQKFKYKCTLCNQDFCQKSSYNRHTQSVHLSGNESLKSMYKCSNCGKLFARKDYLTKHERNYVCQEFAIGPLGTSGEVQE